ncbi:DUF3817 domain-containing protein [Actinomadura viridis]|uniref:Integral membrane protein n=1 Tax=Actinomadura viridis TaxID=58110 RepID=A0A931DG73_9ACTN|nr:DUF3817 domain-containing protein [Actinomadura viridis]MBG6086971.1 integral membrane protein [Actinomadura viridis]
MDIVRALRIVSIAEATSFLVLLLLAMPLKYIGGEEVGVQVVGPVHGILFMGYVAFVVLARGVLRDQLGWNGRRTVLALIASVLPVAPLLVERYWLKKPAETLDRVEEVPA